METSQNPYSKPSFRIENYKKKLEQRSNSQDWIFGNVFGKPGGGAPLRDRSGQIISKIKTIADGNIDRLNPEDFSRGYDNVIVMNRVITTPQATIRIVITKDFIKNGLKVKCALCIL